VSDYKALAKRFKDSLQEANLLLARKKEPRIEAASFADSFTLCYFAG